MITSYTFRTLTWVDAESPTPEEVRSLMETYGIHPAVGEELLSPTRKPRVTLYKNLVFSVLHFPVWRHTHKNSQHQEVDFIIGEKFLITTRYDAIDAFHKFGKVFEVNSVLEKEEIGDHAGFLFLHILKKLYRSVDHELDYIHDLLAKIEEELFDGNERGKVFRVAEVSRQLTLFSQALAPHNEILASLRMVLLEFFGKEFGEPLRLLQQEYSRTAENLALDKEFLAELRDTNDTLLTTRENETIKTLTIMAFVTFPLTLIASIFGMNVMHTPLVGNQYDFWLVIGVMAIATLCMFSYFKYKHWF